MADLALSPLLQVVFDRLASPVLGKLRDLCGLKENFEKLQQSLPMIQGFLEDAEEQKVADKAVKIWLSKLKDIAYDSDDLLDELATEITRCENRSSIGEPVRSFLLPFEPSRRLFDIACELQKMLKVLDKVAAEGFSLNLKEKVCDRQSETFDRNRETGSFVIKSEVFGRGKDKEKILELLLPNSHGKIPGDVSIIPIVGIGGLGKTTLAQLVYNDDKLIGYFDLKIWVYVSDEFDVKKLIKAIVESAVRRTCEFSGMDILQSQLRELLCGKRYLLILDDVWIEDQEVWDRFQTLLRGGVEGSRVLVTTRCDKVASVVGTTSPYHLKGLPEDDCWALFKQVAFPRGDEEMFPNLLPIGRQILKKCAGVPLAAKMLGCRLRQKRKENEWLDVEECELYNMDERQSGVLPTLRVSYNYLPPHLKRCFAYCSLFPKNYEFQREKLICLWVAEGLVLSHGGYRLLEDIGNDYFDDLLWLSFFQEVRSGEDGSRTVYKMHDLIHDLAQSIKGNEFEKIEQSFIPSNLARTRHLSVVCDFVSSTIPQSLLKATRLRTLLFLSPGVNSAELPFLPVNFPYLRVLDLSGSAIKRLQKSISELMCLRYLDLSDTLILTLPDAMCDLCNLQTLNLSGCCQLEKLPSRIHKLTSLRHLITTGCETLTSTPAGIGKLIHLQTWPIYIVGLGNGESLAELRSLNLRGELNIKSLENVRDAEDARSANLKEKKHLHTLRLFWGDNDWAVNVETGKILHGVNSRKNLHSSRFTCRHGSRYGGSEEEEILKGLEPHPNLTRLFIKGYPGFQFPNWLLPNLIVFVLINCKSCTHLPTLGQLPFLKTLYLEGMDNVECISREFYGLDTQRPFPSLKNLSIRRFPNLKQWSDANGRAAFPCLEKLIVSECPSLTTTPIFPSLQHLELQDCHPVIINSMEILTSLSILVIDKFPELLLLSGKLLENNIKLMSLKISSCRSLRFIPSEIEKLTALKSLVICSCDELSSLPQGLQNLKSLEFLEISGCHDIVSVPDDGIGGLSSLRTLSVENCNNLTSLSTGLQYLLALEQLTIVCPKLASFPSGLQNLSSLRSLSILCCTELVSLPEELQYVKTLQTLEIRSCPGLTDLPEWVEKLSALRSLTISDCQNLTSLPDGLQCISKLQHLSIQDCPNLESWYKEKGSNSWQKIAHIPHVYIGPP